MMMHHAHNHDGDLGLHYNDGKLIITSKMVPGISQLDLQKINCICSTNPMASIIFVKMQYLKHQHHILIPPNCVTEILLLYSWWIRKNTVYILLFDRLLWEIVTLSFLLWGGVGVGSWIQNLHVVVQDVFIEHDKSVT